LIPLLCSGAVETWTASRANNTITQKITNSTHPDQRKCWNFSLISEYSSLANFSFLLMRGRHRNNSRHRVIIMKEKVDEIGAVL
jgi:hypothetical protein